MKTAAARQTKLKVREEVIALKRQRTLDAATELFYEKGYTNTTLDEVASRLGVTKPFIYTNFGSKSDLLVAICRIGVRNALSEIDRVLEQGEPSITLLKRFVPRYVASVLQTQKNIAINIREEKNLLPEHAEELAALRHTFMLRIESLLIAACKNEGLTLSDPRVTAFAIVGAVSWSTFWFNPGGSLNADDMSEKMTDIILNLVKSAT